MQKTEPIPDHLVRRQIADILHTVHDPEIPGISIVDLGMVLDIRHDDDTWHVDLAPTYSGCPAIDVIPILAKTALAENYFNEVDIRMVISPPWSTDWISEEGNEKLHAWGIAPPNRNLLHYQEVGKPKCCPQCGSEQTNLLSTYGSTPCKAVYKCENCLETFDYFKCY